MFGRRKNRDTERVKLSKESYRKALRIFRYLRPYRLKFGIGLVFLLFSALTSMLFPGLIGKLVGASKSGSIEQEGLLNLENINSIALLLLIVFAAQATFSFFRIYLFSDVTERMIAQLRQETYSHLIKLPMSFFSTSRVGDLNSRISADIALLQETFTTTLAEFLRQFVIIGTGVTLLAIYSYKLTLLMMITFPVMILLAIIFGKFIKKLSNQTQDKISESSVIIEETFTGITNVKAFVNEYFEVRRYRKSTDEVRKFAMKGATWRAAFASFVIFTLFGSIVLVIWYGVQLKEAGEFDLDVLVSFIIYSVFVGASLGGSAEVYAKIQRAIGATENLMDLLDKKPEPIQTSSETVIRKRLRGEIAFNNVSFRYPSRQDKSVLDRIDFSIEPGQQIAIVGPSGAGKSTIVSLLLRFYVPVNGSILVDKQEIASYDLSELRNQMAIVPQEVLLFGGTIRENIAYGKPSASDEEIREAAEKANATEFIEGFPDKFDTIVGERGIQLSGGQRQRIAIARAVLKNPSILILDEATSSLDSEAEKLVQDALEQLMKDRTSIVIAHRLSTIRNADQILVLDEGVIKESGTHDELILQEEGLYKNLSKIQFETA